MPHKSQAQKRAEHALKQIETINTGGTEFGNYLSYVQTIPATIIRSGLGQALAMEKASAKPTTEALSRKEKAKAKSAGHYYLYQHLQDWLCMSWETSPYKGKDDIIKAIIAGTEADYISAQIEVMEYLEWLKKFAVAFLPEKAPAKQGKTNA